MDLWSLLLITTCAAVACNGAGSDLELLKNSKSSNIILDRRGVNGLKLASYENRIFGDVAT